VAKNRRDSKNKKYSKLQMICGGIRTVVATHRNKSLFNGGEVGTHTKPPTKISKSFDVCSPEI
jgi:hypothetical protein